jgi:hypothetical protein
MTPLDERETSSARCARVEPESARGARSEISENGCLRVAVRCPPLQEAFATTKFRSFFFSPDAWERKSS